MRIQDDVEGLLGVDVTVSDASDVGSERSAGAVSP